VCDILEKANLRNSEQIGMCRRLGWGKGLNTKGWRKRILWVMELLCVPIAEVVNTNVLKQNCTYKKLILWYVNSKFFKNEDKICPNQFLFKKVMKEIFHLGFFQKGCFVGALLHQP